MDNIKINWSTFPLDNKKEKGVIAVLMYFGEGDPKEALDSAVRKMVQGGIGYFEMIDANQDNPWTRVLMTNVNEMKQTDFNPTDHHLGKLMNDE